ncbi:MAG: hypothetical protein JXR97_02685 [Planctomycetes bacterium]|nr:hypothetical protein [Planctomycetota bacterium]
MRTKHFAVLAFVVAISALAAGKATLPLTVYGDTMSDPWPYVPSGYMGNTGAVKMDDKCTTNPKDGKTCLKVTYSATDNWAGVVWQSPANDWGEKEGGWDLSAAKKVTFWARGEEGGEKVKVEAGILGKDAAFPDSEKAFSMEITMTKEWKQYTADLTGKDLSCIKTGFCWVVGGQGKPITFYFDEIKYE